MEKAEIERRIEAAREEGYNKGFWVAFFSMYVGTLLVLGIGAYLAR